MRGVSLLILLLALLRSSAMADVIPHVGSLSIGDIRQMAFSPDGELLAVVGQAGLAVLETRRMTVVGQLQADGTRFPSTVNVYVRHASYYAFSSDSKTLLVAATDRVFLFDVETGTWSVPAVSSLGPVRCVAFAQEGHVAAFGTDELISVWDLKEGVELHRLASPEEVRALAFGKGDSVLVSLTGYRLVRFWNLRREALVFVANHDLPPHGIVASRTSPVAATSASDGTVRLWDLAGPDSIATLSGLGPYVHAAQFSEDGRLLAFESHSSGYSGASVWRLNPMEKLAEIAAPRLRLLGFASDDVSVFVHLRSVLGLGGAGDFDKVERYRTGEGEPVDTLSIARQEAGFLPVDYSQRRAAMAYAYSEGQPVLVELGELWQVPVPPDTAISTPDSSGGPSTEGGASFWPNPSRGDVTIRFSLAARGPVEIRVYNLAGQPIKTLARGTAGAGGHSLLWDGRDDRGARWPRVSISSRCPLVAAG